MTPKTYSKISRKILAAAVSLVFLFSFGATVFAEDLTNETDNLRRTTRQVKQVDKTADKAEEKEEVDKYKTGVTYADILKDPDNIDLNYRYAQNQIAKGELMGSAATLERILLVNPNLADVRLLYGVVLYRLDSLNEAQRELETLKTVPLPPKIRADVDLYQKRIKSRKRRTHVSVRENVGWGYDTNRNASPSSKFLLTNNAPVATTGSNTQRADTNFLNVSSLDVTHDLGFQAGHSVFGSFTYYLQEQNNVKSLDLGSFQYELGGTFKSKYVNFTPSFFATDVFLSSENFIRSQGGNFLFEHNFTKKLDAFYNFRMERQDYMNISEDSNSYNRKGPQFDHAWGLNYVLFPTVRWSGSLGLTNKYAKQHFNAYNRVSINNNFTWILPKGQFLINGFNVYFDNYDAPEFTVASRLRQDRIFRYRTTYGVPLTTLMLGKILPGPLKDTVFTFSYEYYRSLSNTTNYTYTNNKLQTLLSFRWEY